jgi:hypothetical protein
MAAAACFAVALGSPRVARADFAEDVKDIIEQLIEDDIATHVVPNAAADIPITCDLFPASIGALQAKRYTGLPPVIRKDLADAVGLFTFLAIEGGSTAKLAANVALGGAAHPIPVSSVAGPPRSGSLTITDASGLNPQKVTCNGVASTSFAGCTGTPAVNAGGFVFVEGWVAKLTANVAPGAQTIPVSSIPGFPRTLTITDASGQNPQTVTCNGMSFAPPTYTDCMGGAGNFTAGGLVFVKNSQFNVPHLRTQTLKLLRRILPGSLLMAADADARACTFEKSWPDSWQPNKQYDRGALVSVGPKTGGKLYQCKKGGTSKGNPPGTGAPIIKKDGTPEWQDGGDVWWAEATPAPSQSAGEIVLKTCAKTQQTLRDEIACAVAISVRDAGNGDEKLLPGDLQRTLLLLAAQALIPTAKPPAAPSFAQVIAVLNQAIANKTNPTVNVGQTGLEAGLVQGIANEISTLTSGSGLQLSQVLATASDFSKRLAPGLAAGAAPDQSVGLEVVEDLLVSTEGVYQIIKDVQAKNYGAAVGQAFDLVDEIIKTDCTPPPEPPPGQARPPSPSSACVDMTNKPAQIIRNFIKVTAIYAVDSATSGNAGTTPATDFKNAAVELIEELSGSGIRRRVVRRSDVRTSGDNVLGVYLPNFSLRAAVRPGHAGVPPTPGEASSAFMPYVSIDWPNFRMAPTHFPSRWIYWGFDVSVIDALGPVWEIAMRNPSLATGPNSGGVGAAAAALQLIAPRVEFEFGVPALTKNLAIGVGGAFRFVRADQTQTASGLTVNYCYLGNTTNCVGGAANTINTNNLEGSIFVKYVP